MRYGAESISARERKIISRALEGIERERVRRGISYRELAGLAGLSHSNAWRVLTGDRIPQLITVTRLAEALGLEVRVERARR